METHTTVVRLKMRGGVVVQGCDVYIGRPAFRGGWQLPGSKWANPFRGDDRREILERYEAYVRSSPELMGALLELRGKTLGCWCVGQRCLVCRGPRGKCGHASCHGDVLVKLLEEGEAPRAPPGEDAEHAASAAPAADIPDDDPLWEELGM